MFRRCDPELEPQVTIEDFWSRFVLWWFPL